VRSIGKRAGLGNVHPRMLRAAFVTAALDAGVPLREVQLAARPADPRTTTIYDRRRQNLDRHAATATPPTSWLRSLSAEARGAATIRRSGAGGGWTVGKLLP